MGISSPWCDACEHVSGDAREREEEMGSSDALPGDGCAWQRRTGERGEMRIWQMLARVRKGWASRGSGRLARGYRD